MLARDPPVVFSTDCRPYPGPSLWPELDSCDGHRGHRCEHQGGSSVFGCIIAAQVRSHGYVDSPVFGNSDSHNILSADRPGRDT
jgi:hypothetical protein